MYFIERMFLFTTLSICIHFMVCGSCIPSKHQKKNITVVNWSNYRSVH